MDLHTVTIINGNTGVASVTVTGLKSRFRLGLSYNICYNQASVQGGSKRANWPRPTFFNAAFYWQITFILIPHESIKEACSNNTKLKKTRKNTTFCAFIDYLYYIPTASQLSTVNLVTGRL